MSTHHAYTGKANIFAFYASPRLSEDQIALLLKRLARGHISTQAEEYADLKRALLASMPLSAPYCDSQMSSHSASSATTRS